MTTKPVALRPKTTELRKAGEVVGLTDRVYDISGRKVTFAEVSIKGDLSGDLEYNGKHVRVIHIDTAVGLLIDSQGVRGPVWQGVECEVLD